MTPCVFEFSAKKIDAPHDDAIALAPPSQPTNFSFALTSAIGRVLSLEALHIRATDGRANFRDSFVISATEKPLHSLSIVDAAHTRAY